MRPAKAQISLRIRTDSTGPSLSANRIIRYFKIYEWREKTRMIFYACAGWSESAHFAHVQRHCFAWRGQLCTEMVPPVRLKLDILKLDLLFVSNKMIRKMELLYLLIFYQQNIENDKRNLMSNLSENKEKNALFCVFETGRVFCDTRGDQ